jgi:hypothetical protein
MLAMRRNDLRQPYPSHYYKKVDSLERAQEKYFYGRQLFFVTPAYAGRTD